MRPIYYVVPFFLLSPPIAAQGIAPPPLQLAVEYQQQNVALYRVSEKLDGVRAYWDGKHLISRSGHRYSAPSWFTAGFPTTPLDGELWLGRGQFAALSAAVRRYQAQDEDWRAIRFMVFDLPASNLAFDARWHALQRLLASSPSPYLELVEQQLLPDNTALAALLTDVERQGGEGLVLRARDSLYRVGRNQELLKLKSFSDAEATVIAHLPGQGKYQGMLGALLVESVNGQQFRIGTGFSDAQRQQPPALNSIITYRYQGETQQGIPRFASFLRERPELP